MNLLDLPARSDFRSRPHLIIRDPGDARRDALDELDAVGNRRQVVESPGVTLFEEPKIDTGVSRGRPTQFATVPARFTVYASESPTCAG